MGSGDAKLFPFVRETEDENAKERLRQLLTEIIAEK
jgi:thioester reductase-like protein